MKKQKTVKKIKSSVRSAIAKTGSFIKKANKKADKAVKVLAKEWKKETPQREKYLRQAKKVGEKLNKISGDVFETIKKDLNG